MIEEWSDDNKSLYAHIIKFVLESKIYSSNKPTLGNDIFNCATKEIRLYQDAYKFYKSFFESLDSQKINIAKVPESLVLVKKHLSIEEQWAQIKAARSKR